MSSATTIDVTDVLHLLLNVLNWVVIIAMGLLAWAGKILWTDVQTMKGSWMTRDEFDKKMQEVHSEREAKHRENLGNFGELRKEVNAVDVRVLEGQVAIERRLGEVMAKIAELRPQRPDGGPERRRGY